MEKHQKSWEKPQLIVLAQGTPEESVLTFCKTENPNIPYQPGPQNDGKQVRCNVPPEEDTCENCKARPKFGT